MKRIKPVLIKIKIDKVNTYFFPKNVHKKFILQQWCL